MLVRKETGEEDDTVSKIVYVNVFSFPVDPPLKRRWIQFTNRAQWEPTEHSGICIYHFDEKYLIRSKRVTLNYKINPVPTIITNPELLSKPSLQASSNTSFRKPPTKRKYEHPLLDQTEEFKKLDLINCFEDLSESFSPVEFLFKKMDDSVLYHRLFFEDNIPFVESISIDRDLHVKLHHKGNPIPLPEWFRKGSCKLNSASMLENLVAHMHNVIEEMPRTVLSELNKLSYYKPQGRPAYSKCKDIHLGKHILYCWTSFRCHRCLI